MSHPYRTSQISRSAPADEDPPSTSLVVPLLVIWIASAARLAIAVEGNEPFGLEPTLAAIIVTSPVMAYMDRREQKVPGAELPCEDGRSDG